MDPQPLPMLEKWDDSADHEAGLPPDEVVILIGDEASSNDVTR